MVEIYCHKPHCKSTVFYLCDSKDFSATRCRCKIADHGGSLVAKVKILLETTGENISHCQLTIKPLKPSKLGGEKRTRIIIDELYVVSKYRRMKLGSYLLTRIISGLGDSVGCTIEVVPRPFGYGEKPGLENLKKFYGKLGFQLQSRGSTTSSTSPVMIYSK